VVLEAGLNDLKVFSWGQLMQFVEQLKIFRESRKLEALVASMDGTVWDAVGSATLMQWNQEADRMQEVPVAAAPVK
jgi:hypothetical protein